MDNYFPGHRNFAPTMIKNDFSAVRIFSWYCIAGTIFLPDGDSDCECGYSDTNCGNSLSTTTSSASKGGNAPRKRLKRGRVINDDQSLRDLSEVFLLHIFIDNCDKVGNQLTGWRALLGWRLRALRRKQCLKLTFPASGKSS